MKLSDINYLVLEEESKVPQYLFFDTCEDLGMKQSNEVTSDPIDAINGTSLQERKKVSMITVNMTGTFSNRNTGRDFNIPGGKILFTNSNKRLENIVDWLEKALEDGRTFTVCKKGVLYHNQLLNNLEFIFDESYSKISVSMSFIEIEVIEVDSKKATCGVISQASIKNMYGDVMKNTLEEYNALDIFKS